MALANRLNDLFEDLIHYMPHSALEGFQFLWQDPVFYCADGLIHLLVNVQEFLKNVLRCFNVLKQGLLRALASIE